MLDTPGYQKKMPEMYAAHKTARAIDSSRLRSISKKTCLGRGLQAITNHLRSATVQPSEQDGLHGRHCGDILCSGAAIAARMVQRGGYPTLPGLPKGLCAVSRRVSVKCSSKTKLRSAPTSSAAPFPRISAEQREKTVEFPCPLRRQPRAQHWMHFAGIARSRVLVAHIL